jgi:polyhydroxybutyrate depolymerase
MKSACQTVLVFSMVLWGAIVVSADKPAVSKFQAFRYKSVGEESPLERKYLLFLPDSLKDNAPLVFVLHGYRGDARDYMGEIGMNALAAKHGFAVCYPQGSEDFEGRPHWNAGLRISKTNDVEFLSKLALDLQKKHGLNPKKTFVCGVSNGGFMSYTLVAENPGVFKAAASVIGTMSGTTWRNRANYKAVPILQMTGMHDEVVPHDGSMPEAGGWGGAPDQEQIIKFWSDLAGATKTETVEMSPQTTVRYLRGGNTDIQIWFYKIKEMGHEIPNRKNSGIDASNEIWRFFSQCDTGF